MAHHSREIIHSAVTRHPTDAWVAQQLREATPRNHQPRFLIRDNDKKYGKQFSAVARSRVVFVNEKRRRLILKNSVISIANKKADPQK